MIEKKVDIEFAENGFVMTWQICENLSGGGISIPMIRRRVYSSVDALLVDLRKYLKGPEPEAAEVIAKEVR